MKSNELVTSGLGIAGVTLGIIMWPMAETAARTTEVDVSQANVPVRVVRERRPDKAQATFQAEPAAVEPGTYVRFDIQGESRKRVIPRWSCIATANVSECFRGPVQVAYLPGDERMVLTVTAGYLDALATPEPDAEPAIARK